MKFIIKIAKYILIGLVLLVIIAFMDMNGLFQSKYPVKHSGNTDTFIEPIDTTEDTQNLNDALDEIEFNKGD